jgi:hypothetical protein
VASHSRLDRRNAMSDRTHTVATTTVIQAPTGAMIYGQYVEQRRSVALALKNGGRIKRNVMAICFLDSGS